MMKKGFMQSALFALARSSTTLQKFHKNLRSNKKLPHGIPERSQDCLFRRLRQLPIENQSKDENS